MRGRYWKVALGSLEGWRSDVVLAVSRNLCSSVSCQYYPCNGRGEWFLANSLSRFLLPVDYSGGKKGLSESEAEDCRGMSTEGIGF